MPVCKDQIPKRKPRINPTKIPKDNRILMNKVKCTMGELIVARTEAKHAHSTEKLKEIETKILESQTEVKKRRI